MNPLKVLLVIDIQEQFKDSEGNYEKIVKYCEENRDKYNIIIPTAFENRSKSNFVKFLDWNDCMDVSEKDIPVKPKRAPIIRKHGYAAERAAYECNNNPAWEIDIVGCDSDACVLATAFYLWDHDYNFRILTDYIYTTAKEFTNEDVIKLMRRNFGKCII